MLLEIVSIPIALGISCVLCAPKLKECIHWHMTGNYRSRPVLQKRKGLCKELDQYDSS